MRSVCEFMVSRGLNFFTNNFFLWTILAGFLAFIHPPLFTWFRGDLITIGLGLIMLGMGVTLRLEDFRRIFRLPGQVLLGIALQYTIMPFAGLLAGLLFNLPPHYAVGLVLVASCPGGTASNVISFLARANIALSVTMTAFSTMMAVIMTPALTGILAGNRIDVNVIGLFLSAFKVVLLPVALGILFNRYLPRFTSKIRKPAPAVAVLLIVLIVGSILGGIRDRFLTEQQSALRLIFAVMLLHFTGFSLGYILGRFIIKDELAARTISIEVGMQNSGLGVVLARENFINPLVAVPAALSAICHCIFGSLVAAVWRRRKIKNAESEEALAIE